MDLHVLNLAAQLGEGDSILVFGFISKSPEASTRAMALTTTIVPKTTDKCYTDLLRPPNPGTPGPPGPPAVLASSSIWYFPEEEALLFFFSIIVLLSLIESLV